MPFPNTPLRTTPRRRVVLTRRLQNGFPPIAYRVSVEGEGPTFVSWRYVAAWRHARRRAEELGIALEDRTVEPAAFREAGHLDESLAKRLARTGGGDSMPGALPAPSRGQWRQVGEDAWAVEVPPTGLTRSQLFTQVALVVGLTVLTALLVSAAMGDGPAVATRVALAVIAGALPTVPALGLTAVLFQGLLKRETVYLYPDALFVTTRIGLFETTSSIAWDDIEDLLITADPVGAQGTAFRLPGPLVLVVRMADRHFLVGDGLLAGELVWMRDTIFSILRR